MNRDTLPPPAAVAAMTGELMVIAREITAGCPRLGDLSARGYPRELGEAAAAVHAALGEVWPRVLPEAARDVLYSCARVVCEAGADLDALEALESRFPPAALEGAAGLLELTAEYLAEGGPHPPPAAWSCPPLAYASSLAFDRSEDRETLAAAAVLLTLAHLGLPGAPG